MQNVAKLDARAFMIGNNECKRKVFTSLHHMPTVGKVWMCCMRWSGCIAEAELERT